MKIALFALLLALVTALTIAVVTVLISVLFGTGYAGVQRLCRCKDPRPFPTFTKARQDLWRLFALNFTKDVAKTAGAVVAGVTAIYVAPRLWPAKPAEVKHDAAA